MSALTSLGNAWRTLRNRVLAPEPQVTTARVRTGGRSPAGIYVTPDTALKNPVVWACCQYLTKTVAQLPWRVMLDTDKGAVRAKTNPVDWLLGHRPCPDLGSFNWRVSMLLNALMWGNGYAEIERDNRGAAYALWPLHPERVSVRRNDAGELEYDVWNRSGTTTLAAADMFHLRGFGDGPLGYGIIDYAAQSIGWAQATELFSATYFGSGANPTGVVETNGKPLSPEGMELLKADFNRLYAGPKADKTVFLDNGYTYKKISIDPKDGQFIETMQHQVEDICRWFGVPPHKVMHLLRATFSNIEHQSIEVVVDSVMPWIKALEEEANYKLFGSNRLGYYTKIDVRGLLRGDSASRADYYTKMHGLGMTLNTILGLEDLNGIGPDGDVSFVSNNVQTLERAIRGQPAAPAVDLTNPASVTAALRLN